MADKLSKLFTEFFESEKAGGILLIVCTAVSIIIANSAWQQPYHDFWHLNLGGMSIEQWVNDALMAIFFLLIGLELEREVYIGELSSLKNASLPLFAALGGMLLPAAIFLLFNYGTPAQSGAGIPMATDIAFAIGILSLLGKRVPASLKVLLTAIAVIDDLGAILVIAIFYTTSVAFTNLLIALTIFGALLVLNRLKVKNILPYLLGGIAMWYFMHHSGVHATITGVLLAFAIPFQDGRENSTSYRLQHWLHKPVAFIIVPLFALANTAIAIENDWYKHLVSANSAGIAAGLVIGKPIGILIFCVAAVKVGIASLPGDLQWRHIVGIGLLAGIGFTMSIFITLLAYDETAFITESKIAILAAAVVSGLLGYLWLNRALPKKELSIGENPG